MSHRPLTRPQMALYALQDALGLYMVEVYEISAADPAQSLYRRPALWARLVCRERPGKRLHYRRWSWN